MAAIQRLVRRIGPDILMTRTDTLEEQIDESLLQERVISALATVSGALALVLSAVGLYGVLACSVARRTREIGIQMALGALPSQVAWSVLRQTLWLVGLGFAAGVPVSIFLASLAEKLLYGVAPADASTQASVAGLILLVSAVAALVPALRASHVAPAEALRRSE